MVTVAVRARTFGYPRGGGHAWAYLNWVRGLQRAGCDVVWLEVVKPGPAVDDGLAALSDMLSAIGLGDQLVVAPHEDDAAPARRREEESLDGMDLLLDLAYDTPQRVVDRFQRSALVDIDPGQTQCWWADGHISPARHDVYFTTGERIGGAAATVPGCGVSWNHVTPAVDTASWPHLPPAPESAPFTTVTHWAAHEWFNHAGIWFDNSKRAGFLPYLDLPGRSSVELELAVPRHAESEADELRAHGWRVTDSWEVAGSLSAYQRYVQASRGEFSCAKPSTVHLDNAWISDRTLCYLSTGRPAVVQHTGRSASLPDREGLLRFTTPEEARSMLDEAHSDYDRHSRAARELAASHFDAEKAARQVLERALA